MSGAGPDQPASPLRAETPAGTPRPPDTTAEECLEVANAAEVSGRLLQIAHVLRYAHFFRVIHDVVASGSLQLRVVKRRRGTNDLYGSDPIERERLPNTNPS